MYCHFCQKAAPTAHVTLYRNLGLLVMRQWTSTQGAMCRECARSKWLSETLTTAIVGWWGLISFFANLLALANNIFQAPTVFGIPREGEGPVRKSGVATAVIALGVAGVLLGPMALLSWATWHAGAGSRRAEALREKTKGPRAEPTLAPTVACELAEEADLSDRLLDAEKPFTCERFTAEQDKATLEVATYAGPQVVCLRKGPTRWFVAGVGGCAQAPLSAQTAGGTIESQEKAWRAAESKAVLSERRRALDMKLEALAKPFTDDTLGELPACEETTLEGYERTYGDLEVIGLDAIGEPQEGARPLEFLTTPNASAALGLGSELASARLAAVKKLEETPVVALLSPTPIAFEPKANAVGGFAGGAYLADLLVADLQEGKALCQTKFGFVSADNVSFKTHKYDSATSKQSTMQRKVDEDFLRQYMGAKAELEGLLWEGRPDKLHRRIAQVRAFMKESFEVATTKRSRP